MWSQQCGCSCRQLTSGQHTQRCSQAGVRHSVGRAGVCRDVGAGWVSAHSTGGGGCVSVTLVRTFLQGCREVPSPLGNRRRTRQE